MAKILIVEDEKMINELILRNLQAVGHRCVQAYDGAEALERLDGERFDLVILDIMLPRLSGFEVMSRIHDAPVIFLTAMGNVMDKVRGLGLGAEDYIVKPFEMLELIARVDVVLRRTKAQSRRFNLDGVTVDFDNMTVTRGQKTVELTPQELSRTNSYIPCGYLFWYFQYSSFVHCFFPFR